jgi:pimeloyl-ACP methyl ester carboxylesterase
MSPIKVIFPLHGIRTFAPWQKALSDLVARHGWVCRLQRWSYGRFRLLGFLTPASREAKLNWFHRQYDDEITDLRLFPEQGRTPSVVAHSFGTYILGYALLRFPFIRFNKVILCGSILPRDFPWDLLIARGQVQAVRNEFSARDKWVKLVHMFVRGTGPSGAFGFTCAHERLEQQKFDYEHGEYFGVDHMEDRWVPFLNKRLPENVRSQNEPCIPRPTTTAPWAL